MRKYIKNNIKALEFINRKDIVILSIRPIKKTIKRGLQQFKAITSYCIEYEKMI